MIRTTLMSISTTFEPNRRGECSEDIMPPIRRSNFGSRNARRLAICRANQTPEQRAEHMHREFVQDELRRNEKHTQLLND